MTRVVIGIVAVVLLTATASLGCAGAKAPSPGDSGPTSSGYSPIPAQQQQTLQAGGGKIKLLTTISVISDFIRQVGQDRVVVRNIVPAGNDPHTFQPTPQDVRDISEARIIFINGMGLEGPLEALIRSTAKQDSRLVVLSEGLLAPGEAQRVANDPHADENTLTSENPHLWLDVRYARLYVQRIQLELAAIDPDGAATYERVASAYLSELDDLDAWIEQQIRSLPEDKRRLVTLHDAFPYFASRYGLRLVGVVSPSPEREPSAKEVANLVEKIKRERVRTVFAEPQLNARVLEVIAKEAGVRLGILYSDSVDDSISSYASMMRYNTEQIVNGLR